MELRYLILSLLLPLIRRLPLRLRSRLGLWGGYLFAKFPSRERTIAELQFKRFLRINPTSRLLSETFGSLGQTALECLDLSPMLNSLNTFISCTNDSVLQEMADAKHPHIILAAHTGNWELMAARTVSAGVPLATVGQIARREIFQRYLTELRESYGIKTLWRGDKVGTRDLVRELKANHVVAALIDQDTNVKGCFVPFFGTNANTPSGLVELGLRLQVSFVSTFCFRIGFLRYVMIMDKLPPCNSVEELIGHFHQRLETHLRRYPTQWVWHHKRWRSNLDGSRMSGSEYIKYLKREAIS